MEEIKLKRITLFILEIIILQQGRYIDESFVEQINDFIYNYYEKNIELFQLLFDKEKIEKMIENKWEVIPQEIIISLLNKYHGFDGYIELVDDIGYETDKKINELVLKFLDYYNELLKLKFANPSTYPKILQ